MPRDIVLISRQPPGPDALAKAAAQVGRALTVAEGDHAAVVRSAGENDVLTVARPTRVPCGDEVWRLAGQDGAPMAADSWWIEAWAPWGKGGEVGVAVAIQLARLLGGHCVIKDGS
jgi:hypothetical protein